MSEEIDVPVNLSWTVQCRVACQALIHKTSFNEMANYFLKTRMQQVAQEHRAHPRGGRK